MKLKSIRLTLFLLLVCAATMVYARGTSKDRKAEKILNEYVSAIGGKTALQNIHNLVSKSELKFVESGLVIDREIIEAHSDKCFIKVSSPQMGEITRGYDGKTCWEKRQGAVRIIEGEEKKSFLNSSSLLRFAEWENHLIDYTYAGTINTDGKEMHKIEVTTRFGINESWYFSKNSGYLERLEEPLDSPEGPATVVTAFNDYKEVNGVQLPFSHTITMPGQTRQISYSNASANREIDDMLFRKPESN